MYNGLESLCFALWKLLPFHGAFLYLSLSERVVCALEYAVVFGLPNRLISMGLFQPFLPVLLIFPCELLVGPAFTVATGMAFQATLPARWHWLLHAGLLRSVTSPHVLQPSE